MIGIKNLKFLPQTGFRQIRILDSSKRNNILHDLTVTEMMVTRFVGTGNLLLRHSSGHKK